MTLPDASQVIPELFERNLSRLRLELVNEEPLRTKTLGCVTLPVSVLMPVPVFTRRFRSFGDMRVGWSLASVLDQTMQVRADANQSRQCEADRQDA